jgi:hypothetical protein
MNGEMESAVRRLVSLPVGLELMTLVESVDRATLDGEGLVALLTAEHRLACRFGGRMLASMAALHEGTEPRLRFTVPTGIACSTGCSDGSAVRRLELATDLAGRLPQVLEAMLTGGLDERKARLFSEKTRPVKDPQVVAKIVAEVLPVAAELTHEQVADRLYYRVTKYDPDAAARRAAHARECRRVEYQVTEDGTALISGVGLPVEQAAAAIERVDAFALAARLDGDPRSLQQLRADAFLGLLAGTWHGPAPVHRVGVLELTVPLTTLMGLDQLPGELAGWGPLCADLARQTAEQMLRPRSPRARVQFVVHDDDESDPEQDGMILASGTTRRRPPAALGAKVRARTNRCIFPNCTRRASRCDLDHQRRWADGGATSQANLHPLCRRHHRAKDEAGWTYTVIAPGIYRWTNPYGQTITTDRRRFHHGEAAA